MSKILFFEPHLSPYKEFIKQDGSWDILHAFLSPEKIKLEKILLDMYEDFMLEKPTIPLNPLNIENEKIYILRK